MLLTMDLFLLMCKEKVHCDHTMKANVTRPLHIERPSVSITLPAFICCCEIADTQYTHKRLQDLVGIIGKVQVSDL